MIQRARSWTCRVTGATWLPQTPEAVVKSADSSATPQKWWADPKLPSLMVENWMTINDNRSPTELLGMGCKLPIWPRLSCVERLKIFFNFKANVPDGSHRQKPSETDSNLTCVPYGCVASPTVFQQRLWTMIWVDLSTVCRHCILGFFCAFEP